MAMFPFANKLLGPILMAATWTFVVGFSSPSWNRPCFAVPNSINGLANGQKHTNDALSLHSTIQDDFDVVTDAEDNDVVDDPNAIDPDELGLFGEEDCRDRFVTEWDPEVDDDPNDLNPNLEYVESEPVDEEGIEIGWDPLYGPSNPVDTRTVVTQLDSYVIAKHTRNESMVAPTFVDEREDHNPEVGFNKHITRLRKKMRRIETYKDPYLVDDYDVPHNVAEWYGYPEKLSYPKKDYMNNKFTKPEDKTDFTKLTPYQARRKAVEMARLDNNEWLPKGISEERHRKRQQIFRDLGIKVGSLQPGEKDPDIVQRIRPCLKVLGSCAELLEIYGENLTVFRFHYHGALKNRKGIAAWTETMIRDCGVECTGVVMETLRGRDKFD